MTPHFTRLTGHALYGPFSRGQQATILSMTFLGEEDWSKVTRLQFKNVLE
jgi:hypothetical protein